MFSFPISVWKGFIIWTGKALDTLSAPAPQKKQRQSTIRGLPLKAVRQPAIFT